MFFVLLLLHMYFPSLQYKAVKTPPIKKNSYTLNFMFQVFHASSLVNSRFFVSWLFFCWYFWVGLGKLVYTYGLGWESRF